ncbi:hypothetical protein [Streptomyces sp. 4N124]|uniref:hypothetical protein n=1 Tax=Streptomyces sp. 4N124 TaxID=3457420 RepID=UPI003FD24048
MAQACRVPAPPPAHPPRSDEVNYRDRVRLDVLRNRLLVLPGDETGLDGLRALAEQAQADAGIDLAADVWRTLAGLLTPAARR